MSLKAVGNVTVLNVDDGATGAQGVSVTGTAPQYYLSTSPTQLTGGTWVDSPPEVTTGTYLWERTRTTLSNSQVVYSNAVYSATISGVKHDVDQINNSITNRVWQSDINTSINSYDGSTVSSIRDRVTQTETDITGITSRVSSVESTTDSLGTRMSSAESSITQNANNIALKVSADGVISSINQSPEQITISADKVNIAGAAIFDSYSLKSQTVSDFAVMYAKSTDPNTFTPVSGADGQWSVNAPEWEAGKYIWQRTAKTINGSTTYSYTCIQGASGQSSYTYVRYSANANGSGMVTSPSSATKYIGIYTGDSSTVPAYTAFTWSKYIGEDGNPGNPGTSSYTFVRYSANSDGSSMTSSPQSNSKYIGIYTGTSSTAPSTASSYTWSQYRGNDGTSVSITSIKYAISDTEDQPNDSSFTYTSVPTVAEGKWLWTLTTYSSGTKLYTKSKQGVSGAVGVNVATVYLYQRATSSPAVPSANTTYTFSTGVLSGTLGSWQQTIPSGTNSIWMTMATASSSANNTTDTIATGEWSTPVEIAKNGIDGYNQATINLYQRASTTPSKPSSAVTYTFSTGALSSVPTGWSRTVPASNANKDPCYITSVSVASQSSTYSIAGSSWSSPTVLVEDGVSVTNVTSTNNTADDGYSTVTITLSNGTTKTFQVKNGSKGSIGATAQWYYGTALTHISGSATLSASSTSNAVVGSMYLNTDTSNVYKCTAVGTNNTWTYAGSLLTGLLENLEIGGTNLLRYTESPKYTGSLNTGWSVWSTTNTTVANTTDGIKITIGSSTSGFKIPLVYDDAIVGGEAVTLSFEYRTNLSVSTVALYLLCASGGNKLVDVPIETSTSEWKRFSQTITFASTSGQTTNYILIPYNTNCWFEIKNKTLKLEKGNIATTWTPAPEDALAKAQQIYYRSNSDTAPNAPTAIITSTSDSTNNAWTISRLPMIDVNNTNYRYCYTCEQLISVGGYFLGCTPVVADKAHTVIDGGNIITHSITSSQLATDAIQSLNYYSGSSENPKAAPSGSHYSATGTFLDLQYGDFYTPNFGVDSQFGHAYINGEIIATSGRIGSNTNTSWTIGTYTDFNMDQHGSIIGNGDAFIQSGKWMISGDRIDTRWYDNNLQLTYIYDSSTNAYYDYGINVPNPSSTTRLGDTFLYIRKHVGSIPVSDGDWTYLFRVAKDGTVYVNEVAIAGANGDFLSKSATSSQTVAGSVTFTQQISGSITKAGSLSTSGTIRTNLASTSTATYTSGGNITPGVTGTLPVGNGGTGQTTAVNAANAFLNALSTGSSTPVDADYYISQYVNGGTTTTTYHRRPMSALWEYIKNKLSSDHSILDNLYVSTSGGVINGNLAINGSLVADEIIAGSLIVNGDARFVNAINGDLTGNASSATVATNAITAEKLSTNAGSGTQPVYFSNGIPVATTYALNKTVPADAKFTDTTYTPASSVTAVGTSAVVGTSTNYARQDHVHNISLATGDSNGQVKIAGSNVSVKGLSALAYKASLGASDVGLGNVTNNAQVKKISSSTNNNLVTWGGTDGATVADSGIAKGSVTTKITLAGTDYSASSNVITITKANLQSAVQDTSYVLMTSEERSKLGSIAVSSGGTIDFSGVTASAPLTATVNQTTKAVNLTHNTSGATAGTYRSVTVNTYGHVTAGTNPTTLSGYGITDAKIASGTITLGSNTITPLTADSTIAAGKISGTVATATKATQDGDGNTISSTYIKKAGDTMTNLLTLYREGTTTNNYPAGIKFSVKDTTTGQTYSNAYIYAYQDHASTTYGTNMIIHTGGGLFLGSGESPASHYSAKGASYTGEETYLTSDGGIYIQSNGNTIANRVGLYLNASHEIVPIKADVLTNNVGSIGTSTYKWANMYATTFHGALDGNASTATTASKLGSSTVGGTDRPIYLNAGTATQTTYRMASTNAVATTARAITDNLETGIWYVNGTNSADLYSIADGAAYVNKYDNNWIAEIYQDYRTGQIALRGKNNGTWQAWRKVLDSSNYTTWAVSLSGDQTISGAKTFTGSILGNGTSVLGSSNNPFHQLVLGGTTSATMTASSTNPRITFQEGTGTQPVHLIYTDYDNYRSPAGLKVIGGSSATPAWFEVEGATYSKSYVVDSAVTLQYNTTNKSIDFIFN